MMDADPFLLAALTGTLVLVAVSSTVWALAAGRAAVAERRRKRLARYAPPVAARAASRGRGEDEVRRHASEILARRRGAGRVSIRMLLDRAGLGWPSWTAPALCALLTVLASLAALLADLAFVPAALFGAATGPAALVLFLKVRQARRLKAISRDFPTALDIIVRGVKSGLPLIDCLRIVSREAPEPLRGEFARLLEQQSYGLPLSDAVDRMAARIPISEVNFFAIVIGLQSRTGGRLSESLDNLVSVLRARVQLRAKIKSMSSEAKASGGIIGALPAVVSALVWLTSPQYIGLLFTEPLGNVVLVASGLWMLLGVLVMAKMIRIEV